MRKRAPIEETERHIIELVRQHPGIDAPSLARKMNIGAGYARECLSYLASEERKILRCVIGGHHNRSSMFYMPGVAPTNATFSKRGLLGPRIPIPRTDRISIPQFDLEPLGQLFGYDKAVLAARSIAKRIPNSYECRFES